MFLIEAGPNAIRALASLIVIHHFIWRSFGQRVPRNAHIRNATMAENRISNVLLVGLPGDFLDHPANNAVPEIGVSVMLSRRMVQRLVREGPRDQLLVIHLGVLEHGIRIIVRPPSGSVCQQVLEPNLTDVLLIGRTSEIAPQDAARTEDQVVEAELAMFNQVVHRHRHDGLCHARDAEQIGRLPLLAAGAGAKLLGSSLSAT